MISMILINNLLAIDPSRTFLVTWEADKNGLGKRYTFEFRTDDLRDSPEEPINISKGEIDHLFSSLKEHGFVQVNEWAIVNPTYVSVVGVGPYPFDHPSLNEKIRQFNTVGEDHVVSFCFRNSASVDYPYRFQADPDRIHAILNRFSKDENFSRLGPSSPPKGARPIFVKKNLLVAGPKKPTTDRPPLCDTLKVIGGGRKSGRHL